VTTDSWSQGVGNHFTRDTLSTEVFEEETELGRERVLPEEETSSMVQKTH
jgi:hypothetical protein